MQIFPLKKFEAMKKEKKEWNIFFLSILGAIHTIYIDDMQFIIFANYDMYSYLIYIWTLLDDKTALVLK